MSFSDNLYRLRAERNMTQEQLAMLMGVSRQAISKWESARAYPEMDKLVRLCDVFGCDLDELVRGDIPTGAAYPDRRVPVDAEPTDISGYDSCMRGVALMLASSAASALLGIAVLFGTAGTFAYDGGSGLVFAPLVPLLRTSPFGLPALVVGLVAALSLAALAANRYLGFTGRFPYVEDFYTEGQREQTTALARRARIVAAVAGAIAIGACLVKSGPLCHVSGGLCSLFAWGGVAAWSCLYAQLMVRRLDVERYNRRNAASIEQREAARAVAELPATRALVQANPEVPRLAKVWVKRQTAIAAATALAGFGLLAGVFALLGWPIWFIPLAVGITAAVLIWVYMPVAR